ncbi:MAG TPA: PEP-CTERM sorting domain-containing protein [Phenylobacterium sp.]|jgi:hypothetical protein
MTGLRYKLLAAAAVAGFGLAAAGSADAALNAYKPPNYTFPSGFSGFQLKTSGGPINPGVLVGFNPQPEPPGDVAGFGLHNPPGDRTLIGLLRPQEVILNNPADGGAFDFLIALLDVGDGFLVPAVQPPNRDGFTGFHTDIQGHDISVNLQFGGSEITSWSWGAFNPQPDPPGDWGGGKIGFAHDPFMAMRISVDGAPLSFSMTPEPATWGLMLTGFFGLGLALRARRRSAAAA